MKIRRFDKLGRHAQQSPPQAHRENWPDKPERRTGPGAAVGEVMQWQMVEPVNRQMTVRIWISVVASIKCRGKSFAISTRALP